MTFSPHQGGVVMSSQRKHTHSHQDEPLSPSLPNQNTILRNIKFNNFKRFGKKNNETELTINTMELNNRKITNHPPFPDPAADYSLSQAYLLLIIHCPRPTCCWLFTVQGLPTADNSLSQAYLPLTIHCPRPTCRWPFTVPGLHAADYSLSQAYLPLTVHWGGCKLNENKTTKALKGL